MKRGYEAKSRFPLRILFPAWFLLVLLASPPGTSADETPVRSVASPRPSFPNPVAKEKTVLRLFVTSDLHGWITSDFVHPGKKRRGFGHLYGAITRFKQRHPKGLLVDAGDFFSGSLSSYRWIRQKNLSHPLPKLMVDAGYDFVVWGNHDFESYFDLKRYLDRYGLRPFSSNVKIKRQATPGHKNFLVDGFKISLIGFTTPDILFTLDRDVLDLLEVGSVPETARKIVAEVKATFDPDVIIGVFHVNFSPYRNAGVAALYGLGTGNSVVETLERNPGFDWVISGHDHSALPNRRNPEIPRLKGIPYLRMGAHGKEAVILEMELRRVEGKAEIADASVEFVNPSQEKIDEHVMEREAMREMTRHVKRKTGWKLKGKKNWERDSLELCLTGTYLKAVVELTGTGAALPPLRIGQFKALSDKQLTLRDLYFMIPYDNNLKKLSISAKDFFFLRRKFASRPARGKRARYNRKLVLDVSETVLAKENAFSSSDIRKRIPFVFSGYHANGGGGLLGKIFVDPRKAEKVASMDLRSVWFDYLKRSEPGKDCPMFEKL